jgi:hypothetical protein
MPHFEMGQTSAELSQLRKCFHVESFLPEDGAVQNLGEMREDPCPSPSEGVLP